MRCGPPHAALAFSPTSRTGAIFTGKVEMAFAEQFWGDSFGSVRDRFGTQWMFNGRRKT